MSPDRLAQNPAQHHGTEPDQRAAEPTRVVPGQVWRRRRDSAHVTIEEVKPEGLSRRTVTHQGTRRTYTQYDRFLSDYELHREDLLVEALAAILTAHRPHTRNPAATADALADAVALVDTLGLHEIFTVAWDGEPSMSGVPHAKRIGSEFLSQEQAERALTQVPGLRDRDGIRVQRRLTTTWRDVATNQEER